MKILNLIVARGGSKGIPGKNLKKLGGLSLVAYKAIAAKKSKQCSRLIISSDSKDIQIEAQKWGAEVLFDRPPELATDTASSSDVIMHTITWFEENTTEKYDAIMLLEPSSPFATFEDLDHAASLYQKSKASAVVGVREMEVCSALVGQMDDSNNLKIIMEKMSQFKSLRRQDFEKEYTMNGGLYLFSWNYFKKFRNIYADINGVYGYPMAREYSIELDEQFDFNFAEFLVNSGKINMKFWDYLG